MELLTPGVGAVVRPRLELRQWSIPVMLQEFVRSAVLDSHRWTYACVVRNLDVQAHCRH